MLKKIFARLTGVKAPAAGAPPTIVPRDKHSISRRQLSTNVLKVLYRLNKAGYQAFLVGGAVRDLLVGRHPKDFDVATNARPEQIRALFSNCRLIGRRFRLAHIYFGPDIIEVATFRSGAPQETAASTHSEDGMILQDNQYGTLEEDAWRRDFSINALYYNIEDFSLIDYTGGMADLRREQIRIIGDADQRFREDPVRLLRAIRFSALLNMPICSATQRPMKSLVPMLSNVSSARLFDEIVKLFHCGASTRVWQLMQQFELVALFFPQTLEVEDDTPIKSLIGNVLQNTDERIAAGKSVTPVFVLACLLWYPLQRKHAQLMEKGEKPYPAILRAADLVLKKQAQHIAIPQRISQAIKEIWFLQKRLEDRRKNKVSRLAVESRFRAAYDFLLLRAEVGEPCEEAAIWWTEYTEAQPQRKHALEDTLPNTHGKRRRHHAKRRRNNNRQPFSSSDDPSLD
jgi:poly(A) polymerase